LPRKRQAWPAEEDRTLDRTFTASPLILPSEVDRDLGLIMAGRVLGCLPVLESVADLTYRVTLDRMDIVRIASSSAKARMHLRDAMAQLDSLCATTVGFELARVVGRHLENVSVRAETHCSCDCTSTMGPSSTSSSNRPIPEMTRRAGQRHPSLQR
jgi:hypothetical protein